MFVCGMMKDAGFRYHIDIIPGAMVSIQQQAQPTHEQLASALGPKTRKRGRGASATKLTPESRRRRVSTAVEKLGRLEAVYVLHDILKYKGMQYFVSKTFGIFIHVYSWSI